jgi:rubrerythrin
MDSHNVPDRDASAQPASGRMPEKPVAGLSESADLPASRFASLKDILDYAVAREKEAHDYYQILIALAKKPDVRRAFEVFASDELRHAEKLQAVRSGDFMFEPEQVGSLGIADKAHSVRIHQDMNYTDALVVAMRKEKAAFRLYTKLATLSGEAKVKRMFSLLAQEEAGHKLGLELEYDLTTF